MQKVFTEDSIKQEFNQSLSSRVNRYLKVKPHGVVPYTKFAPVSAESTYLFRDGHFYGSISLSQSVAEAIVKFLCQKNGWKPNKNYEENVLKLQSRNFISIELKDKFLKLWQKRDDYHHLNSTIETDRKKLEKLAFEKINILREIESEIFKFSIVKGAIVPKNIKYWDLNEDGTVPVFLKLG